MNTDYSIHWFRRDFRLEDNNALSKATEQQLPVKCIFIFDTDILHGLPAEDRRVSFIKDCLENLKCKLQQYGSDLFVYYGNVLEIWRELAKDPHLKVVYTNEDYEPYAVERDSKVVELLESRGICFHSYKDQVVFAKDELLSKVGNPYSVYTPYSRAWKNALNIDALEKYQCHCNFIQEVASSRVELEEIGFRRVEYGSVLNALPISLSTDYGVSRDYPILDSTSHLSIALRFGTISIRELVKTEWGNQDFIGELIWREFFMQILWHYPRLVTEAFREKYDKILWRNDNVEFQKWCEGKTGYPIVDAGMRELNATGYMHNRVRMITASFLVKHLLIDWRLGEAYFAKKLMDYELSANNGNWQWVAGCGTDAAPYFRIFNPITQHKKFDKDSAYILKWIPEYGTVAYPQPMVEHRFARERCLKAYKEVLL